MAEDSILLINEIIRNSKMAEDKRQRVRVKEKNRKINSKKEIKK